MSKYSTNSEMQKFEELLTPYIQGHLDDDTRLEVEQYAESSAEFAELLKFEQRIAASVQNTVAENVAVMPSFGKLKRRINAQSSPSHGIEEFFAGLAATVRGLNPGLLAASLAVVAIVIVMLQRPELSPVDGGFETLSEVGSDIVAVAGRKYLNVVFEEHASEQEIAQLARELQFVVEAGPNSFGAYTVSIEANDKTIESTTARWSADDRFVFVKPARVSVAP